MEKHLKSSKFMGQEFPFWMKRVVQNRNATPIEHSHEFVELVYVVRGEAQHCFEGERYAIRAGDVFIINPGEVHAYDYEQEQQIEIINCIFMPSLIQEGLLRELGISRSMDFFYVQPFLDKEERFHHRLNLSGPYAATLLVILESMMAEFDHRNPGFDAIIRLKMIELQIFLSRNYNLHQTKRQNVYYGEREVTARRIRGYLERNYGEKITLTSLVDVFNISERKLNRLMKEQMGMSVIELLHQIRIEKAKHLLEDQEEKVINVASMVGYEDPAFFSRLFRRIVGCPPGTYRKTTEKY
ncbi:HTH-type transcriptional activator RhaR [Paenibacillus hodogayensis]